ncbi:aldehyde dehydrogenase family protein [Streptomyces sp. B21-083]|uniref:aldehyde dehydrogenase family protein n=1 Tax=Streptomyces sp. B21-083 TaxID=3039410 RepID=UPI002FF36082
MAPLSFDAAALVDRLRGTFRSGRTRPVAWRREQLGRLRDLLTENSVGITDAVYEDLQRPHQDSLRAEVNASVREIDHVLRHLDEWLRPQPVPVDGSPMPPGTTASTSYDPLGVVLIIGPWNHPVHLLAMPMIGALAAGNTVVVKPSELAPATSALFARRVAAYLDSEAVAVVEGAAPETTALLAQRFDHIFYTGNGAVGRVVARAAAEHLTPVTLELGGKCPVFVDSTTDLDIAARRLAESKFANAGQTCVAPDYVLTDRATSARLAEKLRDVVTDLYGEDPSRSPRFGRLVNERHFDRVERLLSSSGRTVVGGQSDRDDRYVAPTVLVGVSPADPVMQEEILGPILPIVEVEGLDEAIAYINDHDSPLALYGFTEDETARARLTDGTSSGGVAFGQAMWQLLVPDLPFGGVGESGMGNYHGRSSLATFSHLKSRLDVPA